jgi:hypothetical protein
MTSKHADWFETSVKYDKMGDAGTPVTVKETYSLESFTFTEAEETIAEELKVYISGEFDVVDMKKAPYKEVFFSENPADDRWYKVKAQFIIIDEKTEKEKYSTVTYLVQSNSLQNAVKGICEVLDKGMQDWKLSSITETKLLDVFEKKPSDN